MNLSRKTNTLGHQKLLKQTEKVKKQKRKRKFLQNPMRATKMVATKKIFFDTDLYV